MLCRHIVNVVHGFIDAGIGIQVTAKFYTLAAAPFYEVVSFKVIAAVESHVFKEVGKSALAFFLLNRTYFLCNVKVGTVFGPVVVADVVGKSVA